MLLNHVFWSQILHLRPVTLMLIERSHSPIVLARRPRVLDQLESLVPAGNAEAPGVPPMAAFALPTHTSLKISDGL
jgi:hypothetical protein